MSASKGLTTAAIAIGIIAILLGGFALATLYVPGLRPGYQGKTQKITIQLGEGEIIQEVAGVEELKGEFHRWEPDTLVVMKGDTVELTVKNPRSHDHSFVLVDFGVDTGEIEGHHDVQPKPPAKEKTVTFVASKAGVFKFQCNIPFVEATHETTFDCDPDHARMVGYLIVLEP